MPISQAEGIGCLRTLVAVARADGEIALGQRATLEDALGKLSGPGADLRRLLEEHPPVPDLLAAIQSPDAREVSWQSAYALAHGGGAASRAADAVVEAIRVGLAIGPDRVAVMRGILGDAKAALATGGVTRIDDPLDREAEVREAVLRYAVLSAAVDAFPVSGSGVAAVVATAALQVDLVCHVALRWGHDMDAEVARSLLAGLGLEWGARLAVANVARRVPGWREAFGAGGAFATSWALGLAAHRYFASRCATGLAALREQMVALESQGRWAHRDCEGLIAAARRDPADALQRLDSRSRADESAALAVASDLAAVRN